VFVCIGLFFFCAFVDSGLLCLCVIKVVDSSQSPDPCSLPTVWRWREAETLREEGGEQVKHFYFLFIHLVLFILLSLTLLLG